MDAALPDVTEDAIARFVSEFYDRIRADGRLGPIFTGSISDWDAHLRAMRDFWSAVLLGTERYRGCVMSPHFGLPMVASDLDRFMTLFSPTAEETLPADAAKRAIAAAESVTKSLRRAVR